MAKEARGRWHVHVATIGRFHRFIPQARTVSSRCPNCPFELLDDRHKREVPRVKPASSTPKSSLTLQLCRATTWPTDNKTNSSQQTHTHTTNTLCTPPSDPFNCNASQEDFDHHLRDCIELYEVASTSSLDNTRSHKHRSVCTCNTQCTHTKMNSRVLQSVPTATHALGGKAAKSRYKTEPVHIIVYSTDLPQSIRTTLRRS